jgi:hypothetical protein
MVKSEWLYQHPSVENEIFGFGVIIHFAGRKVDRAVFISPFHQVSQFRPGRRQYPRRRRYNVPDASAWAFDIAAASRNQVNGTVEDGLAGGFAGVDADVEALYGRVRLLQVPPLLMELALDGCRLRGR